jgi:protein-S-isoprenylcysteine O-methyltransferase Ste14
LHAYKVDYYFITPTKTTAMNKTLNYVTIVIILIFIPALVISYFQSGKPITVFTYIGLALMIPGFILLLVARIQLGASFSITAQANKLITSGLYKKFRHPIYYSSFLLIVGIGIFLQEPKYALFCVVIIFLQLRRIGDEEKVLEEKFGEEYRAYKKNTWF